MSDLRTRIAAALAAEFDGKARKFDDAGWEGVADAVIRELGLIEEESEWPFDGQHRYVTEWENNDE